MGKYEEQRYLYLQLGKKTDKISRTSNKEKGQKECNLEDIENQKSKDKQHVTYLACLSELMARQVKRLKKKKKQETRSCGKL